MGRLGKNPTLSLPHGAGPINAITTLAHNQVVSAGDDGVIRLWSEVGELLDQRFGHTQPIVGLAGDTFESLWSLDEGGAVHDPHGRMRATLKQPVRGWAPLIHDPSDPDKLVAAVLTDKALLLVVIEDEQPGVYWSAWPSESRLTAIAPLLHFDRVGVAVGDASGILHLLSFDETQLCATAYDSQATRRVSSEAHDGPVRLICVPGAELFTAGPKGELRVWNWSPHELEPRTATQFTGEITAMSAIAEPSHSSEGLLVGFADGELHLVEFDYPNIVCQRLLGRGREGAIRGLTLLDDERFAYGAARGTAVWARFGRELCSFPQVVSAPVSLAAGAHEVFTLDGRGQIVWWSSGKAYRRGSSSPGATRLVVDAGLAHNLSYALGPECVDVYLGDLEIRHSLTDHRDLGAVLTYGDMRVTGDADKLRWWTREGQPAGTISHEASPVIGLTRWPGSNDGMISAHRDGELWIWSGRKRQEALPNRGPLQTLVISQLGTLAVLTRQGKIVWRIPNKPKHLEVDATHLIAGHDGNLLALGQDRKIYSIGRDGELTPLVQTYQGRLTGIAALGHRGELVTSGADGSSWYWKDNQPTKVVAELAEGVVLELTFDTQWPISISRSEPWDTKWFGSRVRVPIDPELHRLLAFITRDESRETTQEAPRFRVALHDYEEGYGELWRWEDQNNPRRLEFQWPRDPAARSCLQRALLGPEFARLAERSG